MSEENGPYFHDNFFAAHRHDGELTAKAKSANVVIQAYLAIWEKDERKELPDILQRDIDRMIEEVEVRL